MGALMSACPRREKQVTWKVYTGEVNMKAYRSQGSPTWTCKTCSAVWTRVWDIKRGRVLKSIGSSQSSGSTVGSVELLDTAVSGDDAAEAYEVQSEDNGNLQTWLVTAGNMTHKEGGNVYYCPDCTSAWVPDDILEDDILEDVPPKKKNKNSHVLEDAIPEKKN